VTKAEWVELPDDVRREPVAALVAQPARDGAPGLADVETLLGQSLGVLARPGAVVLELAPHQAEAAAAMAGALGYTDVTVEPDLAGRARALVGRVR
jgi:methylase of polypeptide subunit release factors